MKEEAKGIVEKDGECSSEGRGGGVYLVSLGKQSYKKGYSGNK